MRRERRDDNERDLIECVWNPNGATCVQHDRDTGYDLTVCYQGQSFIVEVKDGSKSPSARELTPHEKEVKRRIEATGVKYWIIESRQQAADMIGVPLVEQTGMFPSAVKLRRA